MLTAAHHFNEGYNYLQIKGDRRTFSTQPPTVGVIDIGFNVVYLIKMVIREDLIQIISVDNGSEYAMLRNPVIKAYAEQAHLINKPLKEEVIRSAFSPKIEEGIVPDALGFPDEKSVNEQDTMH